MAEFRHNAAALRYELIDGGVVVGILRYRQEGPNTVLEHAETARGFGGKGVASSLVTEVLDDLRTNDRLVVAECSFVRAFIDSRPEYSDMLA